MIALAGCQTAGGGVSQAPGEPGRKETIGTLSGAVVGGALANQMAEGSDNQQFATFFGRCGRYGNRGRYWGLSG